MKIQNEMLGRLPRFPNLSCFQSKALNIVVIKAAGSILKQFTRKPDVILAKEDAGVVSVATDKRANVGIVMSHESHNHHLKYPI